MLVLAMTKEAVDNTDNDAIGGATILGCQALGNHDWILRGVSPTFARNGHREVEKEQV
jgi:hypothetical protein